VAIEPSRQFRDPSLKRRLEIAQINNLETESAKNRQEVFESIGKMYGGTKNK
jgi:hypothetical protein